MKKKLNVRKIDQKVALIIANAQQPVKGQSSCELASRGMMLLGSVHICDVILPGI